MRVHRPAFFIAARGRLIVNFAVSQENELWQKSESIFQPGAYKKKK